VAEEREVYIVQPGSIFTHSPSLRNPPKRYSVLKVLEQEYYTEGRMSSKTAWEGGSLPAASAASIPIVEAVMDDIGYTVVK